MQSLFICRTARKSQGLAQTLPSLSRKEHERKRSGKIIEIGSIKLNTAFNEIVADGNKVEVSDLEYKILRLMMQHPGKIFDTKHL